MLTATINKHTSRIAKTYLKEIIKSNVEKRMPKNISDLEQFMTEEWNSIPNSILINPAESMPRCCELVIESNGERINY
jgi:hypothetical protein